MSDSMVTYLLVGFSWVTRYAIALKRRPGGWRIQENGDLGYSLLLGVWFGIAMCMWPLHAFYIMCGPVEDDLLLISNPLQPGW